MKYIVNSSKSVNVIFQNGFSLLFGRNEPELLKIFQTFLVQQIWDISHNESLIESELPDFFGLENPFP